MTATEDAVPRADENNPNLDNTKPHEELPMDVDKNEESSSDVPKEPEEDPRLLYERKAKQFLRELCKFHENAGTPIVRHPKINGKDVDLYELYTEMTKLGGWVKVNTRNDWDELLENLAFPKACVNAAVAIKYIYIRYLDRYEKLHFLGEEVERVDEDDEDVRQKKMNTRYLHNVPMSYNHGQHYVSEANRLTHKLSTDFYKPTQNEKLFLSLLSPLPNEQNFALNVCMLISNEPVSTFVNLEKCPKLIDALLAHAGVFSHYSLREIFTEFYSNYRKQSLQTFWNECLSDKPHILELSFGDISDSLDGEIVSLDDKESEGAQEAAQHEVISSFLNLKRGSGTQDYVGLRVQQIATILRNLSFVEENSFLFAQSRTFLRFLVLCSNIRWNNLQHMALDMLGNIAEDIELADPITDDLTRCLLSTIMDGLESDDRGVIISCMEVLYKLCRRSSNEDYLYKAFDKAMYQKITSFLWLKDAMLVMYTLECMYALTNMGEKTCNGFVHMRGIMDSLVSLVTLEAKTFGHEGCILMCVVDNQQATVPATQPATVTVAPVTPQQIASSPVKSQATPKAASVSQSTVVTPQKVTNARPPNASSGGAKTPLTSKQTQLLANQENEQNAQEWLRTTYEAVEGLKERVDMQELYKFYVTAMSKLKRGGVVSPAFFPKVVKLVFGPSAGPIKDQGPPYYTGIREKKFGAVTVPARPVKATAIAPKVVTIPTNKPSFTVTAAQAAPGTPKPNTIIQQVTPDGTHVITTVAAAAQAAAAASGSNTIPVQQHKPMLVATTSSGMTITPVTVTGNVLASPQPQKIYRPGQPQQSQSGASTAQTGQSSLIKSLLANKVTTVTGMTLTQSPVQTVMAAQKKQLEATAVQHKTQFFINPTNTNLAATGPAPPPAGAVAAASVIMSNVAAQGSRPTASVPINNSSKLLQVSPNKTLMGGGAAKSNSHPPLILSNPTSSTINTPNVIASNAINVRQVAQRQQLQKQKELAQRNLLNTAMKSGIITNVVTNPALDSSQPPPLAPLSSGLGQKVTVLKVNSTSQVGGTPVIIGPSVQQKPAEETISMAHQLDGMTPPFGDGDDEDEEEASKQSKVTANKMLADLLEKKSDPPTFGEGTSTAAGTKATKSVKRKASAEGAPTHITKRKGSEEAGPKATPSAANLYAEMAASILEDDESIGDDEETEEDISMEEEQPPQQQVVIQTTCPPAPTVSIKAGPPLVSGQPQQVITLPLRQQIIMPPGSGNHQQVILTGSHQIGSGQTATIKTDSGYQTVPILVQPQQQQQQGPTSVNAGASGQTIIQQRPGTTSVHAGQTQYVLATNPQGQTYVVATQSPMQQQMQTLLVTQTPQQHGTQQKTIIILQQQPNQGSTGPGLAGQAPPTTPIQQAINSQGQKIIMTTPQGQQVVMTGGPAAAAGSSQVSQGQRQIVIQQHSGVATHGSNIIVQSSPSGGAPPQGQKQIILSAGGGGAAPGPQFSGKAPAPMDAISQVENTPQHIIKTSTGLQIKPVHIPAQPPVVTLAGPVTQQKAQKAVITTAQQPQQQATVIQGGLSAVSTTNKTLSPTIVPQTTNVISQTVNPGIMPITPAQSTPMTISTPVLTSSASSSPVPQAASSPKTSVGLSTVTTSEGTITVTSSTAPAQGQAGAGVGLGSGDNGVDINWPYVCDWRGCPRRKFKSAEEVFYHACKAHCPDTLDFDAEIFCQWGPGPNLCDGKPRKRFSLMTHFQDRHCTDDKLAAAVQRRLEKGIATSNLTHPITIIRDVTKDGEDAPTVGAVKKEGEGTATPPTAIATTTTSSSTGAPGKKAGKPGTWQPTAEAVSIIKRREFKDTEFTKAWKDDNEGPVSISIRLTASLILRNLVTYSDVAKRMLKCHETHLSQIALSNVESSRTIAQVLYEMNDIHPV